MVLLCQGSTLPQPTCTMAPKSLKRLRYGQKPTFPEYSPISVTPTRGVLRRMGNKRDRPTAFVATLGVYWRGTRASSLAVV